MSSLRMPSTPACVDCTLTAANSLPQSAAASFQPSTAATERKLCAVAQHGRHTDTLCSAGSRASARNRAQASHMAARLTTVTTAQRADPQVDANPSRLVPMRTAQ